MQQYNQNSQIEQYATFRSGSQALTLEYYDLDDLIAAGLPQWSLKFRLFKLLFDTICTVIALLIIAILSLILKILNPFLNPGPLFFTQLRTGLHGKPFRMWKFRTMVVSDTEARKPNTPLEEDRITRLGGFMRKARIDELPNFFNVLRGEMSVVGPRPDASSHVELYSKRVAGYVQRHRVRPGITGLAQVEQGYVEDEDATAIKAKYDNIYVQRSCGRLDLYIILRTFTNMVRGFGAR